MVRSAHVAHERSELTTAVRPGRLSRPAEVESSRVVYDDGDNGPVVDVGAVTA
jgi:hypothetical protein